MTLKSGWCIDAIQAMDMDQPERADRLHKQCRQRSYQGKVVGCTCECHARASDPTSA